MANPRFDMTIRAEDGHLIAATEVKAYTGLTPNIAAELHKTWAEHKALPVNAYFLLVSQDNGYLWKEGNAQHLEQAPLATFSMNDIVERYLQGVTAQRLRGSELALLVQQWLFDLSAGQETGISKQELTPELNNFLRSIRGATIVMEDAA